MEINELCKAAHKTSREHGFYDEQKDEANIPEKLALIHSEVSEALEAHRDGYFTKISGVYEDLTIDKITKDLSGNNEVKLLAINAFQATIKNSFEDELADAVIRIADLCGYMDIDLEKHILAKMAYNETRPYKHGKKY